MSRLLYVLVNPQLRNQKVEISSQVSVVFSHFCLCAEIVYGREHVTRREYENCEEVAFVTVMRR